MRLLEITEAVFLSTRTRSSTGHRAPKDKSMTIAIRVRLLLPVDLDDEELERLERLARNQGRSVEEVISDAIACYLLRGSEPPRGDSFVTP